jgi:hypothetical protein
MISSHVYNIHFSQLPSKEGSFYSAIGLAFGNTMTIQLLDHLHDQYGGVTESELDSNAEQIKQ